MWLMAERAGEIDPNRLRGSHGRGPSSGSAVIPRNSPSSRPTHRLTRIATAILLLAVSGGIDIAMAPPSSAAEVTYSATETIPVPPASTYAGSGGGDGWGVAL